MEIKGSADRRLALFCGAGSPARARIMHMSSADCLCRLRPWIRMEWPDPSAAPSPFERTPLEVRAGVVEGPVVRKKALRRIGVSSRKSIRMRGNEP